MTLIDSLNIECVIQRILRLPNNCLNKLTMLIISFLFIIIPNNQRNLFTWCSREIHISYHSIEFLAHPYLWSLLYGNFKSQVFRFILSNDRTFIVSILLFSLHETLIYICFLIPRKFSGEEWIFLRACRDWIVILRLRFDEQSVCVTGYCTVPIAPWWRRTYGSVNACQRASETFTVLT